MESSQMFERTNFFYSIILHFNLLCPRQVGTAASPANTRQDLEHHPLDSRDYVTKRRVEFKTKGLSQALGSLAHTHNSGVPRPRRVTPRNYCIHTPNTDDQPFFHRGGRRVALV